MNVYIASNENSEPLALILAKDRSTANIAFTSMKIKFNYIEEINPNQESFRDLGVAFILSSKEIPRYGKHKPYRKWRRGL